MKGEVYETGFRLSGMITALLLLLAIPGPRFEKVSEGVYAALQADGERFNDCNSVVLVNADGVTVVDTFTSPVTARWLLQEIGKVTRQPVRYVINTHWHGDHVGGNQAFTGAEIIGHLTQPEDIEKRAKPDAEGDLKKLPEQIETARKQLASGQARNGQPLSDEQKRRLARTIELSENRLEALRQTRFTTPSLVFERRLTLHRGGREIQLLHFRAHTRGDVVVFLPGEKLLITGDLLDDLPFGGHGYPSEWIAALDELEKFDFETMIPGHGRIRRGKEHLRLVREVFVALLQQTREAAAKGMSLADTKKVVNYEPFRERLTGGDELAGRFFNFFLPEFIERAYLETTGKLKE